jgi:hypothetical protein
MVKNHESSCTLKSLVRNLNSFTNEAAVSHAIFTVYTLHCTAVHLKIVGRTHGEMGHKIGKSFSPNCPVQCLLVAAVAAAAVYWHTSNVLTHLKFVQHSFYQA